MKSLRMQGNGGRDVLKKRGDGDEVVEGAAEIFFVGEDGQRTGAGGAVFDGLFGGRNVGGDGPGGGRAALDLGDDREFAVRTAQGGGEGGRLGQGGVEGGEFLREDGTQRRSDLPPLPSHDLGEFV